MMPKNLELYIDVVKHGREVTLSVYLLNTKYSRMADRLMDIILMVANEVGVPSEELLHLFKDSGIHNYIKYWFNSDKLDIELTTTIPIHEYILTDIEDFKKQMADFYDRLLRMAKLIKCNYGFGDFNVRKYKYNPATGKFE